MEEQLISFETAKLAKEKGFDWRTLYRYQEDKQTVVGGALYNHNNPEEQELWNVLLCSAPTQSLLQKWLREKHDIDCESLRCLYDGKFYSYQIFKSSKHLTGSGDTMHTSYELALEAGLQEALKLIN